MSESQVKQNQDGYQGTGQNADGYQDTRHNATRRIKSKRNWPFSPLERGALSLAMEQFKALRLQITTEGAAKAWRIANAMLDDETTPARTRWDIARTFLLMAGHVPPKPLAPAPANDRPLVERSTNDLRDLVDRLESELAGRARPIIDIAKAVDMWR